MQYNGSGKAQAKASLAFTFEFDFFIFFIFKNESVPTSINGQPVVHLVTRPKKSLLNKHTYQHMNCYCITTITTITAACLPSIQHILSCWWFGKLKCLVQLILSTLPIFFKSSFV